MSGKEKRAIAIMAKALQEGCKVSCEYAARIGGLARLLRESKGKYGLVVFLGGKAKRGEKISQARAGRDAFEKQYSGVCLSLKPARIEIELEETSRNSIENVRHLVEILRERDFDRVDLLSSDYHLQRIKTVDESMKNQSLLQWLGDLRGELIEVPYYFAESTDRIIRTKAEIYKLADHLNVPRVNLEGILEGKEQCVFPEVTRSFAKTTLGLYGAASDSKRWSDELDELRTLLFSCLPVLNGCLSSLLSLQATVLPATSVALEALCTLKHLFDRVMHDLREMTDPDRPVSSSDWDAMKRTNSGRQR